MATRSGRQIASRNKIKSDLESEPADELSDETEQDVIGEDIEEDPDEDEDDDEDEDGEEDEEEEDDDDDDDDEDEDNESRPRVKRRATNNGHPNRRANLQEQLAASGPAGVAAAAAIATVRKRKRPHMFETNPSVRKRQQTRLIRKLRACIDEYTARVGQQAVVLITMPGKTAHNFKVFGAQPLESVVRSCKQEIMSELEQAVLEQTPIKIGKGDSSKHELPPLVIDGIPTPVEKMTQAQLRAFIPLMLKFSTGRGKPGWGKDSTRPPWWPTTLPWANVRSDARDENEKQRISWTTTLREIVTNCYKYHGREDMLPIFDEVEEGHENETGDDDESSLSNKLLTNPETTNRLHNSGGDSAARHTKSKRPLGSASTRLRNQQQQQQQQQQLQQQSLVGHSNAAYYTTANAGSMLQSGYVTAGAPGGQFMQTIQNPDGTVSLIQVDPATAQILTLPDGTQVRAVRLQACMGTGDNEAGDALEIQTSMDTSGQSQQNQQQHLIQAGQQAEVDSEGQIILTSEDGTQSCYPMSQLVSIPASVYQQFAASGQPVQIITADSSNLTTAGAIQIHTIQEAQEISQAEAAASSESKERAQQVDSGDGGGGDLDNQRREASTKTPLARIGDSNHDQSTRGSDGSRDQSSKSADQAAISNNQDNSNEVGGDSAETVINGDSELFSSNRPTE